MDNQRSLRQTLRRPKTDEEIFDRITPAKHSRSKSLVDVHSSRGVHQAREASREHDRRAQEDEAIGSQHSKSESDSDELPITLSPQRLSMTPRTRQDASDFSPVSALSSAYMRGTLDDYTITPFLDETWGEQLTQWDSSLNRHARFAYDMESSSGDEKGGPREAPTPKPISWADDLSVSEKLELLDRVGEKTKRQGDETELQYLHRVMGLLRLTAQEKSHARQLLVARQDFDRQEDEMLSHYRLEMHTGFLKDPAATKEMTTADKENLLEKHAGPVIAAAHARFNAVDEKKIDAYWKQCGLDKKSWSRYNDSKSTTPNTPKRKRKGSLGEDEFETYTKAFAAQRQNAARFASRPLIPSEDHPNRFRRIDSASPDGVQHKYALGLGYTHVSQRSPQPSSRLRPHVQQPSPQPAASSFQTGGGSNPDSHQQPSKQARPSNSTSAVGGSSHGSQQQPVNQARQNNSSSTRGSSHEFHQQPSNQSRQDTSASTRGVSNHESHQQPSNQARQNTSTSTVGPRSIQSHQKPSNQARQNTPTSTRGPNSSHTSHHQPPHQPSNHPRQNATSTREPSHHDHQHPKPKPTTTTTGSSSSSSSRPPARPGTVSGDPIANAHLSLPRMPPGVDSIFSLDRKRRDELQQQQQEGRARKVMRREEEEGEGGN